MKKTKNDQQWPRYAFQIILALLLFAGCDGEDEPIPGYLSIGPFELIATEPLIHGSISEKITNAKVFLTDADGQLQSLGIVSLPAEVPTIVTGDMSITIDPYIKANGNSLFIEVYPFYERFTVPITVNQKEVTVVKPKTTYVDAAVFQFIEPFENTGQIFQLDKDSDPDTYLEVSDEDVFEGSGSGKIKLTKDHSFFAVATNNIYDLNLTEVKEIFMEVNYKTDIPLEFGVLAIDGVGAEIPKFEFVVLQKDVWNKIYFDLSNLIGTADESSFRFIIRGVIPSQNGEFTLDEALVYLDNIKLISF
ncbi:MAG TPA: hypothetical protein ENJ95_06380 [Bacteroidetes bacterium]|nr:hypothetical protein [Bacteroidota bacterium]